MMGMTIQNRMDQNDKPTGISFRRKDQLSAYLIWSLFEKVYHSNSRFNALDTLVVTVNSFNMPIGFVIRALKSRGRTFPVMAHLKQSIVKM